MKNKKNICVLGVVLLALSGCSLIYPKPVPSLPNDEKNLPTVQEIEVSEAPDGSHAEDIGSGPAADETTLVPFDASQMETKVNVSEPENLPSLFLTEEDANYAYELAYLTGDYSSLDEKQMQVLSIAEQIIDQCQGLSDYDRALFVHDYLTATTVYGFAQEPYSAYGALVEHMAVCQGYAYAYKLCMDLMGIPCITVGGTADNGEEVLSHAWNMIRLENQWYHVDTTWNDATTSVEYGSWCHLYFCVNDAFISQNHVWTDLVQSIHGMEEIPEASDASMFYFGNVKELQTSQEQLENSFDADFSEGIRRGEYCCYGFEPDVSFFGNYASGSLICQSLGDYILLYIDMQ